MVGVIQKYCYHSHIFLFSLSCDLWDIYSIIRFTHSLLDILLGPLCDEPCNLVTKMTDDVLSALSSLQLSRQGWGVGRGRYVTQEPRSRPGSSFRNCITLAKDLNVSIAFASLAVQRRHTVHRAMGEWHDVRYTSTWWVPGYILAVSTCNIHSTRVGQMQERHTWYHVRSCREEPQRHDWQGKWLGQKLRSMQLCEPHRQEPQVLAKELGFYPEGKGEALRVLCRGCMSELHTLHLHSRNCGG